MGARPALREAVEEVSSTRAPDEALTLVHDPGLIERIEKVHEAGGGQLDADTVMSPGSLDAARLAAALGALADAWFVLDADALAPGGQLLGGGSAEGVGCTEQQRLVLGDQHPSELAHGGGLASASTGTYYQGLATARDAGSAEPVKDRELLGGPEGVVRHKNTMRHPGSFVKFIFGP